MGFLKKWASCIASFVAGALGLILSLCTGMTSAINVSSDAIVTANISQTESVKAHKVITDSALVEQEKTYGISGEFAWLKVFSIIMFVVSILLIAYSIIMLLKNLNVIKSEHKVFNIIGITLAGLLVVTVIGLIITSGVYASALERAISDMFNLQFASVISMVTISVNVAVGAYQWIMLSVGIIASIISTTFIILNRKNA